MKSNRQIFLGITLVVGLFAFSNSSPCAPRSPLPPMPEFSRVSYSERFDADYYSQARVAEIDSAGLGKLVESWSGYALQRAGDVLPFVIPGLNGSQTNLYPNGAARFWVKPYWSSASTGAGSGMGHEVVLVEMSVVGKSETASVWSLRLSADGSVIYLWSGGEKESGMMLKSDIAWRAGEWHQVVLNYSEKGTSLAVDGEIVAEGGGTLVFPSHAAAMTVGSNLRGAESLGGEIEDVYCFSRPLKMGFHYTPFKDMAARGAISAEEMAYREELAEKHKAAKALKALEEETGGEGGGGMMLRMAGPSVDCVTNGPVYLTNVVCNFTTNEGWRLMFDVAGGTNGIIYDLFSTPTLKSNSIWTWLETARTCETHYFTNQATNQMFYTILTPGMDRDADSLYDGWEWKHFGTLAQGAAGDYDGDGISNLSEYNADGDPNTIYFSVEAANRLVSSGNSALQIELLSGVPSAMAVMVDNTNYLTANWSNYDSNPSANLGNTEGWHTVWVGLRGHVTDSASVWRSVNIKLDSTPPVLVITNPATVVGYKPVIQLKGLCPEGLTSLTYDITNASGLVTNLYGFVIGQRFNANTWEYTTNYFQYFDVPLANGTNMLTLHATDLAGNTMTTNITFVLDYSSKTNPPVIELGWPQAGTRISGDNYTARGRLDDPTAKITALIVSTNGVTNIVAGLVGREGDYWLENLPLASGTNSVTIIVTDVATNTTVTNFNIIKSSVVLTYYPIAIGSFANGSISDTNYSVWVNGYRAEMIGESWYVDPFLNLNNNSVQIRAIPNTDNGGEGTPSGLGGLSSSGDSPGNPTSTQAVDMEQMLEWPDAVIYGTAINSTVEYYTHRQYPLYFHEAHTRWGTIWDERGGGHDFGYGNSSVSGTNLSETIWFPGRYPKVRGDSTTIGRANVWPYDYVTNTQSGFWFPGGTGWDGYFGHLYFKRDTGDGWESEELSDDADLLLTTGGAPGSTETDLYEISGQAYSEGYGDAASGWDWISTPIPPQGMAIGQLGTLDANGKLYVALPARSQVNAKPKLQGTGYKYVTISARKYGLVSQCFSTTPANQSRTTIGVGEQVRIQFSPELPINAQWSCSSGSISTNLGKMIDYIAPSNSMFSSVAVSVKGQNKSINFQVVEPTGFANAKIISTNGAETFQNGISGAGMTLTVSIAPTNVSFYRVQILEVGEDATNVTGYFTNISPVFTTHIEHGADVWRQLNASNQFDDWASSGAWTQPWMGGGSFRWNIPTRWRVGGGVTRNMTNGWDQRGPVALLL